MNSTDTTNPPSTGQLTHLDRLEAESIHIMREVMAHAENPVMLYSIGKDSSVMLHLAKKRFTPVSLRFRFCMSILAGNLAPCMNSESRWRENPAWNSLFTSILKG